MSVITDIVAHIDYAPTEFHEAIKNTPVGNSHLMPLNTEPAGGTKVFTGEIYAGSFNYLIQDEFIDKFLEYPGIEYVDAVVSIISEYGVYEVIIIDDGVVKLTSRKDGV